MFEVSVGTHDEVAVVVECVTVSVLDSVEVYLISGPTSP